MAVADEAAACSGQSCCLTGDEFVLEHNSIDTYEMKAKTSIWETHLVAT